MASNLYFKHWAEKVKLNFIILSKYILSLTDTGLPLDIIRFINILYLQCEDEEICKKIYPCTDLYCKWLFNKQSKPGEKICTNFLHKQCLLVHCREVKCHNIICINRFQKSWDDMGSTTNLRHQINGLWVTKDVKCICRGIFCDDCYKREDQNQYCLKNCFKINEL